MTITYYARVDYTYNGGDKNFSIPFSYINQSHIIVIKNDTTTITGFTFLSSNQIQINEELTTGDVISIRRLTPLTDRMVVFTDDNILDEECLNLSVQQVFNAMQEVEDREGAFEVNTTENITNQISTSTTNLTTYIVQNVYQAKSEIAASSYTKLEADATFATISSITALDNAYNATLTAINSALEEILTGSSITSTSEIGAFIFVADDTLYEDEIWLEGQEVPISTYSALYAKYGNKYGTASQSGYFKLPDFRYRTIWGTDEGNYGYISAGLPNITGKFWSLPARNNNAGAEGCFEVSQNNSYCADGSVDSRVVNFNASRSSSIYGASNTVQPASVKVRVKTKWK